MLACYRSFLVMKKILILLFSVLSFAQSYTQTFSISGRVTEKLNGTALVNANVYINNSSKGAITNSDGNFSIKGLMPGKYDLVISFIGFQTELKQVEINNENRELDIKLGKKDKVLREVLILDDLTRKRYIEIFKTNLLGFTPSAKRCRIRNLDAVDFTPGADKGGVIAYADEDLVIENPDAGYIIHFQMTDFYFNTVTSASYFFGYIRFEDMAKDGGAKKRWIKRRNDNYYGSTMHFFRSLVKRELEQEGFKLLEKREVRIIDSGRQQSKQSIIVNTGAGKTQKILRSIVVGVPVTEDSILFLYSDSMYKIFELRLQMALQVTYKKDTRLKTEMAQVQFMFGQTKFGTVSGLRSRESPMLVDYRGLVLTPMSVYFDGIWAYERLANMLPEDFIPRQ